MGSCPACRNRVKDWDGDDPKCAFVDGVFSGENWNCATMNALRERVESSSRHAVHWNEDVNAALLPAGGGFLLLAWYKSRGRTLVLFVDDDSARPATLLDAVQALAYARGAKEMSHG